MDNSFFQSTLSGEENALAFDIPYSILGSNNFSQGPIKQQYELEKAIDIIHSEFGQSKESILSISESLKSIFTVLLSERDSARNQVKGQIEYIKNLASKLNDAEVEISSKENQINILRFVIEFIILLQLFKLIFFLIILGKSIAS